ncbi:MAG: NAD(P)/FAD-dependent oxidoreductase [Actinomycetes bacterium]
MAALSTPERSTPETYRRLSFWHDHADDAWEPRPALSGDLDVDVAVVGAGYTGLWTAYHLAVADPSLRIAVLERDVAGFGASGRNGGWCSALFPAAHARVAQVAGREGALALARALQRSVDEVGEVSATEGIDCHYAKGGTVVLARSAAQRGRAQAEVAEARRVGLDADDLRWLGADEARALCGATSVLGATYTPHCAAIHPARLVRGLARAAERRGVTVYEQTTVVELGPRRVDTAAGRVRAEVVVRATEGYTNALPGQRRLLAPVYSLVLATEPLPASFWETVGLRHRETFSDHRHLIVYGQRTADDRLVFGGRGAPYHLGSRVKPAYDRDPDVFASLRRALVALFPDAVGAAVTHTWGGPIGVPRDWFASVGYDRAAGFAWGGGYVGDGVGASQLAGRTLADLVLDRDTDLVHLPWVGHRWRQWEPEPLRWLGVNGVLRLVSVADAAEERTGREGRTGNLVKRFVGG